MKKAFVGTAEEIAVQVEKYIKEKTRDYYVQVVVEILEN